MAKGVPAAAARSCWSNVTFFASRVDAVVPDAPGEPAAGEPTRPDAGGPEAGASDPSELAAGLDAAPDGAAVGTPMLGSKVQPAWYAEQPATSSAATTARGNRDRDVGRGGCTSTDRRRGPPRRGYGGGASGNDFAATGSRAGNRCQVPSETTSTRPSTTRIAVW